MHRTMHAKNYGMNVRVAWCTRETCPERREVILRGMVLVFCEVCLVCGPSGSKQNEISGHERTLDLSVHKMRFCFQMWYVVTIESSDPFLPGLLTSHIMYSLLTSHL